MTDNFWETVSARWDAAPDWYDDNEVPDWYPTAVGVGQPGTLDEELYKATQYDLEARTVLLDVLPKFGLYVRLTWISTAEGPMPQPLCGPARVARRHWYWLKPMLKRFKRGIIRELDKRTYPATIHTAMAEVIKRACKSNGSSLGMSANSGLNQSGGSTPPTATK